MTHAIEVKTKMNAIATMRLTMASLGQGSQERRTLDWSKVLYETKSSIVPVSGISGHRVECWSGLTGNPGFTRMRRSWGFWGQSREFDDCFGVRRDILSEWRCMN
jgi:hypothetical protein